MTPVLLRIFDVILSTVGLLLLFPLIILLLLLGLLDTGKPIYLQKRLGRNKQPFVLIKFRTMAVNTPSVATHLAASGAVTPIGCFLRRTKVDELPQLWNVLRGEMSIVGPRPGLLDQVELTAAREKLGVFNVKPGITGLAQVQGVDMSRPEEVAEIDAKMIANMSISKYLRYILLTATGMGQGDRVTKND